jgi:hypothetical protein
MKVPDAQAAWKAAGFTGPFTSLNGLGKRRIVVHQDLTPGDCMPPTTTITVTVGPAQ